MKHPWQYNHVHHECVVVLWQRDAITDEALEVDELGVLEEQVPRVVCQWFAAAFPKYRRLPALQYARPTS